MANYRYANSILWGDTYNAATGMHHITAGSDQEAFDKANRADKQEMGLSFLFREQPDGSWQNCGTE